MAKDIRESLSLDSAEELSGGRLRIKIIDAGSGSSGDYPDSTLKLAAKEGVFSKGLHMYMDHPTAQEAFDRPERSVKDLAAVLESDAVYVAAEAALYADTKVFPNWREVIKEMKDSIGVSIRASAEVSEGKNGRPQVDRIVEAFSVDFVTKAGRGGAITEVLESARAADRAVQVHGVEEATANELRDWLRSAVTKAYPPADDEDGYRYAWIQDFDESTVWYQVEDQDGMKTFQQAYSSTDTDAALSGEAVQVRQQTTYVPIEPAAEEAASTDSSSIPAEVTENRKESTVTTTQIEESALATLQAQASRAEALEAENKTLKESAVKADAAAIVAEAFKGVDAPKTQARIAESFTLKEDGTLDADALKTLAEESAAEWRVTAGEGSVRGLGDTTAPAPVQESATTVGDEDIFAALKGA